MTVQELLDTLKGAPKDAVVFYAAGDHRYDYRTFSEVEVRSQPQMFVPAGVYLGGVEE